MPARDGSGPQSKGSRTGRGMGNCCSTSQNTNQTFATRRNPTNQPYGRGWIRSIAHFFERRRGNRFNRK